MIEKQELDSGFKFFSRLIPGINSLICFAQIWHKAQVQFASFASPVMRKSASEAHSACAYPFPSG